MINLYFFGIIVVGLVTSEIVSVTVANGELRGFAGPWPWEDVRSFLGIPFARAPVGSRRFMPPENYTEIWTTPWDATKHAADCYQNKNPISGLTAHYSEDCLYLNVWAPRADTIQEPLPVMVFLYGGGYKYGGSDFQLYDGRHILNLAEKPVIVVTLNYRVGVFGFLGSRELQARTPDGSTGNMGLQDQRMALQWVRKNIANFGGDDKKITIWGESAGAGSISNHLVMPRSTGLFEHAIIESGPVSHWIAHNFSAAQLFYDRVMEHVNCTNIDCLLQTPAKLINSTPEKRWPGYFLGWAPTIDGVEIPENPQVLAARGQFANRGPVLLGTNRNEGTLLQHAYGMKTSSTKADFAAFVRDNFPAAAQPGIFELYQLSQYPEPQPYWAGSYVVTDMGMTCPAQRSAIWLTDAGVPVHMYFYTHELEVLKLFYPELGVFHGSELIMVWDIKDFVYDDVPIPLPLTYDERMLQQKFVNYWTNFAFSGDPNVGPSSTPSLNWPLWDNTSQQTFQLDETLNVIAFNRLKQCQLSDKYYRPE